MLAGLAGAVLVAGRQLDQCSRWARSRRGGWIMVPRRSRASSGTVTGISPAPRSPTSGNEHLVLLALADACSRDDGTGCWPSAATIARKVAISDRTVRRVITRLEADGHLIVHRGGGRAGSTNSYTVVTGGRVIHNPGQNDTPDTLSGVTRVAAHP